MRTETALTEVKNAILKFADACEADSTAINAALRDLRADAHEGGDHAPTRADVDAWMVRAMTLLNQVERLHAIITPFQIELAASKLQMAEFLGVQKVN